MTQDTEELGKRRIKGVYYLNCNRLINSDFEVFNLLFHILDFYHKFLHDLAITMPNFVKLFWCVPF